MIQFLNAKPLCNYIYTPCIYSAMAFAYSYLHCLHKSMFLYFMKEGDFSGNCPHPCLLPCSLQWESNLLYSPLSKRRCPWLSQEIWAPVRSLHSSCMFNRSLHLAESQASLSVKLKIVLTSQVRFWGLNEVMSTKFLGTVKHFGCPIGTHLRLSGKIMENSRVSVKSP